MASIIAGVLSLVVIETLFSHPTNASKAGSLVASLVARLVDPSVPAIPDRRGGAKSAGASPAPKYPVVVPQPGAGAAHPPGGVHRTMTIKRGK